MSDQTDIFARLKRLHAQGVLTDQEYEAEKDRIRSDANPGLKQKSAKAPGRVSFGVNNSERSVTRYLSAIVLVLACGFYFYRSLSNDATARDAEKLSSLCIANFGYRLSSIATGVQRVGSVNWDRSGDDLVEHIVFSDPNNKSYEIGIWWARTPDAAVVSDCANVTQGAVAKKIALNGEITTGPYVSVELYWILSNMADRPSASAKVGHTPSVADSSAAQVSGDPVSQSTNPDRDPMVKQFEKLEDQCRDGSGDDPATMAACDKRDTVLQDLNKRGLCKGTEDQAEYQYKWHHCHPGSLGYQGAVQ